MESCVEIFLPSRWCARIGWIALAACAAAGVLAYQWAAFLVPGAVFASTALFFLWLSARPQIRVAETQFNIGQRAIAWREVKEVNRLAILSPLVLRIKLTNSRRKVLIYAGDVRRVEKLVHLLRKHSHLATFDGVAYRDYWTWSSITSTQKQPEAGQQPAPKPLLKQPVRMLSTEEEDEIERMYQKLKAVGSLDARLDPAGLDED